MSESKFKVGDRVVEKEPAFGGYGIVTSVGHYNDHDCMVVKFANGEERVCYAEDFIEDPKTAFLSELKGLLERHNANINFGFRVEDRLIGVVLQVGEERLFYPFKADKFDTDPSVIYQFPTYNYPITPDNIMNYEKTEPCE